MFLHKKYILANELVSKMGIHIANVSALLKNNRDYDNGVFLKLGNCTFIDNTSQSLPNNIKEAILNNSFTDLCDKLPSSFTRNEYDVTENELFRSNIVIEKIEISGKDFYVFDPEFVKTLKRKIGYVLSESEKDFCYENKKIDGFKQLSKNRFFTWY